MDALHPSLTANFTYDVQTMSQRRALTGLRQG
jgi:hypothetical protein